MSALYYVNYVHVFVSCIGDCTHMFYYVSITRPP